jgi:succinoglycan biosynthesis transport protein ExoP
MAQEYINAGIAEQKALIETPKLAQPLMKVAPLGEPEHPSFLRALGVLRKQIWEVVTVAAVVVTAVAIYSFKAKPVYRATARLDIEAETPMAQSIENLYRNEPTPADEAFLLTQTQVLTSASLARETIERLKLADNPGFTAGLGKRLKESGDSDVTRGSLEKLFSDRLSVDLRRNTHIVDVSFESTDRSLAASVVNALVDNYLEYNFTTKYDATRQASGWMEKQLDELKAKVEKSQAALVDYERANSIVNVGEKQNVAEQRLSELMTDLTKAQSDRFDKQSLYQLVQTDEANVTLLAQSNLLERLEEKYAEIKGQYAEARATYGPAFPKIVRLKEQVDQIQSLIQQERARTVDRIRRDYSASVGREKLLTSAVAEQKIEVGRLNGLLIQHNMLKRDFESNQQLYDSLLQRLKDATVTAGLRATNIHVVDKAVPPGSAVRPNKPLNLALGLLGGVILGTALAFLEEALENTRVTIKTPEDVRRLVDLPSLALIPEWNSNHNNGRQYGYGYGQRGKKNSELLPAKDKDGVGPTVLGHLNSQVAESYRALRTSIMFSTAPKPPQVIMVTSAQPKEGKTATAVNLALLMAQTTLRVLLVDCDLRVPGASNLLGVSKEKGVSGILTGAHGIDDALQQVKGESGLWVLPSGPLPPNPAELLCSSAMQSLMLNLRNRFDQIVVDSPPLLLVTDAAVLSPNVDGVVLVVESGGTTPAALAHAHGILQTTGVRVLGALVNKINVNGNGYYYNRYYNHYNSYYSSYYSSSHHSPSKD